VSGIIGVQNSGGSLGAAAYVALWAVDEDDNEQILGHLTKPPGAHPTGVMWVDFASQIVLPANKAITIRANAYVEDGSDSSPSVLRFATSPDYRENFIIQALATQTLPS